MNSWTKREEDQFAENPVSVEGLQGNVEFEHVHFGYNPEHIIINDFSAKVKEGQKIAIVGPTGAGKTTMIKLLMRFYDVNSGAIKIDGHNIKDFNRSELRQMFGMVLQDTWLFSGSIEDNIKYGKLDATHEEVVAAAQSCPRTPFRPDSSKRIQHDPQRRSQQRIPGSETAPHDRQSHPG